MKSECVKLREGVQIVLAPDGSDFPAFLVDGLLEQRLKLDNTVFAVAKSLDIGIPQHLVAEECGLEPELVDRALALLDRMYVLDGEKSRRFAADAVASRSRQQTDPASTPLIIRDDAKFSCTMCGSCCGGHNIGPVSDDVLDALAPHLDTLAHTIKSPKGLFFELPVPRPDGSVESNVLCHTNDGSCVFLGPDRKCRIHAAAGGDKKPGVCQLFPYEFTATPDGIAVSLQMECRGMVGARKGVPLRDQEQALRNLLKLAPPTRIRPVIALDSQRTLSWSEYKPIEEQLHGAIDSDSNPMTIFLAVRDVLNAARDHSSSPPSTQADVSQYAHNLSVLMASLIQTAHSLEDTYAQEDERHIVHTDSLELIELAAATFQRRLERIVAQPETGEQRALFRDFLHHAVHGKVPIKSKRLTLGFARLTLTWFLAHSLAIGRARQVKRRHLVSQDIMDGLSVMSFLFRNNDFLRALAPLDEAIEHLFYRQLPILANHSEMVSHPDHRLELTKF